MCKTVIYTDLSTQYSAQCHSCNIQYCPQPKRQILAIPVTSVDMNIVKGHVIMWKNL